jgi:hypothetical protein
MGLTISAKDAEQLASGIWQFQMPPHQVRLFGECRRTEGARSILLVTDANYDEVRQSLMFDADAVTPLNVGSTSWALAISGKLSTNANDTKPRPASMGPEIQSYGPGDREFLNVANELPPAAFEAAQKLLQEVRGRSPGDLKRGLHRNFSNTPDNFWYVIVQPRSGELSITVRGEPERFGRSELELKRDRPGYSRFKVAAITDVPKAATIIFASKRHE